MTLSLIHNLSKRISFEAVRDDETLTPGHFGLRYGPSFNEADQRQFAIIFEAEVILEEGYKLAINYFSVFEAIGEIPEDFQKSAMVRSNAPAIAFPFLRACIAQITLMAGHKPVVLPSVNFVERSKDPRSALRSEPAGFVS